MIARILCVFSVDTSAIHREQRNIFSNTARSVAKKFGARIGAEILAGADTEIYV